MPLLTSFPSLFPFSFRFFLPTLYPAPTTSEKPPSSISSLPVSKISSFAAHALTNHVSQHHPPPPSHSGLLKEKAETPPPTPTLTVPVRAHLRHTRSADTVFHSGPGRPPLRPITNASSMPYALPSPSPTVVLSVPQASNDIRLSPSFVFPLRSSPQVTLRPSAMATENTTKKEKPQALVLTENKENGGPSRAAMPMPLIPRTSSTSRMRQGTPPTQSNMRAASAMATASPAPQPQASTSAAESSSSNSSPARKAASTSARHTRRPPMVVTVSRELTASPQQPSPPPSSPVNTRAPINLRLDLQALKRTLSEAQIVSNHIRQPHHTPYTHQLTQSQSLLAPPHNTPVTPLTIDERPMTRSEMMVRKKSGELVRPAIRTPGSQRKITKSEPTTPTGPKFVHFDAQLEHVKLFLAEQKPAAVSRDGSPTETSEGELSSTNEYPFPLAVASSDDEKIRRALVIKVLNMQPLLLQNVEGDVRLESIVLSEDARALNGTVVVRNLAYQKWVAIRFTLDNWVTRSEVSARYQESLPGNGFDRFAFSIRLVDVLPRIEAKTMQLAVRYSTDGREIWDNNRNENYRVEFSRRKPAVPANAGHKATKSLPANAVSGTDLAGGSPGKRSEWPVKSAAVDQMADLRRELEKVVAEEMSPPNAVRRGVTVTYQADKSSPLSAPAALRKDQGFSSDSPLGKRYNFGNSLNRDWPNRPSSPAQSTSTIPFPSGSLSGYSSAVKSNGSTGKRVSLVSSRDGSAASSPGSTVPFPSVSAKASPPRVASPPMHIPNFSPPSGDLPRMAPRGSPRDAPYSAFDGTATPPELRPDGLPSSASHRRHHQRSYFDTWPGFGTSGIRKTPPGTPGTPGRFNSYPPLSPPIEGLPRIAETVVPAGRAGPVVPWANLVPLPPSPQDDSTASSTPSIITEAGSSISQSPTSPPAAGSILPGLAFADAESVPNTYNYFLDRFCFYTGGPGEAAPMGESMPRRTMSASDIPSTFGSPNLDQYVSAFSGPVLEVPSKLRVVIPSPPAVPSPEEDTPSTA